MRVLPAILVLAAAAPALHSQATSTGKLDRVDLLAVWLDAVDRHRPGFSDDSLRLVTSWDNRDLATVREHLPTVVSLIREPGLSLFFRSQRGTTRTRQVLYSGNELARLRAIAARRGAGSPAAPCPGGGTAGFNAATDLLKRVAMFHLDLTIVPGGATPRARRDSEAAFTVNVDDGQSLGMFGSAGHLSLAREALDAVTRPCSARPEPARDPWVRDWYAASLSSQLTQSQFEVAHVVRALELFRDDPEILTLSGAFHEALASQRFQIAIGDARAVRERLGIRSGEGELDRATDLLRRAIRRDARAAEPRLRLGNVLGLRGRHAQAARELGAGRRPGRRGSAGRLLRAPAARPRAGGPRPAGRRAHRLRAGDAAGADRARPAARTEPAAARRRRLRGRGRAARPAGAPVRGRGRRSVVDVSRGRGPAVRAAAARTGGEPACGAGAMRRPAPAWIACVAAIACGSSLAAQQATFTARVETVRLDVLVSDRGRAVRGLEPADFEVVDDGVPQRVDVVRFEELPLRVTMAFDMSFSVTGERLDHLRAAGDAVLEGLRSGDQAQLLTFGQAVVRRQASTSNPALLRQALQDVRPAGNTSLHDGAFAATTLGESADGRNLVLLFSDGFDTASWLSADQALRSAQRANVVVYSAAVRGGPSLAFLRDLSRQTGGEVIEVESTRDLRGRFRAVLDEFRQRYLISYTPQGVERRGWHAVTVRVKGRSVTVRTRLGYEAD